MATTILPSATRSPRGLRSSPAVSCPISKRSNDEPLEGPPPAIGVRRARLRSGGWPAPLRLRDARHSPPVEHEAGDDEHRRHRQHSRERFRGCPLGGFLHAILPRLGHDSSLARERPRWPDLYSEHPMTSIRFDESPLSEYRQRQRRSAI